MKKTFWSEISFWMHIPFFLLFVVPFFIPLSVWLNKDIYHFGYMAGMIIINFFWGLFFYINIRDFELSCPLTSLTQYLRGYSLFDKKNYKHSFVAEIFDKFNINFNLMWVNLIMIFLFLFLGVKIFFFS